ncbi:hypothetical protein Ancab_004897 [Ancistrocladus abbreviatus]
MAKGRRLTPSRNERYLGSYNHQSHTNGTTDTSEFREEDVWSMVDDVATVHGGSTGGVDSDGDWISRADSENGSFRRRPRIPRRDRHVGGLSLAFEDSSSTTTSSMIVRQLRGQENGVGATSTPRRHQMATSAPMDVPDWNRILRVNSVESLQDSDDGFDDHDCEIMDPPHEYLARSRKMAAASVFEGVGRTLKGRDMSRLRDSVWSQTGLLDSVQSESTQKFVSPIISPNSQASFAKL